MKRTEFTSAERKTLRFFIDRAAIAAMKQAVAEAAYERAGGKHYYCSEAMNKKGAAAEKAQRETCAAGIALNNAINALIKKQCAKKAVRA